MSWEMRDGRRYYYAARWSEGRVLKDYFGSGIVAELAARRDAAARAHRLAQAQALADEQDRLRPADRSLEVLDDACDQALAASLLAAGYHRTNYGPWRRRRGRA